MRCRIPMAGLLLCGCLIGPAMAGESLETAEKLFRAGKWDAAREAYEALLPELSGEELAEAIGNIGYTWQRKHMHPEAIQVFRRLLKLEDLTPAQRCHGMERLGYSLRLDNQPDAAVRILDEASEISDAPADTRAKAYLSAAWELGRNDRVDEAMQRMRKIEKLEGVHQNYIATALLSIGKMQQARKQYAEAITTYAEIDELRVVAQKNRTRARVYSLECKALLAGDNPFHIRPYATKVKTDEALISWVSQGEIPAGTIEIAPAAKSSGEEAAAKPDAKGSTRRPSVRAAQSPLKGTICQLNSATIQNLQPNTRYDYTVRSGDQTERGSFVTAPEAAAPISFSVIGDTQSYNPGLQPLLDAMGEEKTDFVLHVGDVTDRGELWGEWKASFFDPGHSYLNRQAFFPAYGNHDGGPFFPALFHLGRDLYYSFDWGNIHVIVLDSYGAGTGSSGRPRQLAWLEEDLKKNDKPWTFVALHVPMVATRTSLKWFGADDFLPLMEEHGVDIVFSGHHPHYRRYYPLGSQGRSPMLHVTSGGGGGPVGGSMPSPLLASGIDLNHYCRVDIDGNHLTLTAHAINGAVIDRFELEKKNDTLQGEVVSTPVDRDTAKKLISLYQELVTDRTHELHLESPQPPEAGSKGKLVLNLGRLPRGPLRTEHLPEGAQLQIVSTEKSPWKIASTTFAVTADSVTLPVETPENVTLSEAGAIAPAAEVRIRLILNGRKFEPFVTTARIRLADQGATGER